MTSTPLFHHKCSSHQCHKPHNSQGRAGSDWISGYLCDLAQVMSCWCPQVVWHNIWGASLLQPVQCHDLANSLQTRFLGNLSRRTLIPYLIRVAGIEVCIFWTFGEYLQLSCPRKYVQRGQEIREYTGLYPVHIPTYKDIGAASLLELQFYQEAGK